ncbi:MAG: mechanosensitive ion channel [Planctomycetes bacterium]|nr:mechanosensitive ion channel [Planctomycetota bacterium]
MPFLNESYAGNTVTLWALGAGVAVATYALLWLLQKWLVLRMTALVAKTETHFDDLIVGLFARTKFFFLLAVAILAGSMVLALPVEWREFLRGATVLAVVAQSAIWGWTVFDDWLARYRERKLKEDPGAATTLTAVGFLGKLAIFAVVALVVLDNLGVNISALVAGLGIGGIAIALAVQNILGDLFSSLSIVLDRPFAIGDFVIVDELMGTVEHIGLKTTRIRSLDGEQIVFRNSDLLGARIRNFKRMFERRVLFTFGVLYETPLAKVEAIPSMVRGIIEAQDRIRFDRAHFKGFGDSSLDFEVVYYVKAPEYAVYMDAQQAINLALMRRFLEEGISFAYPTRTVYLAGGAIPPSPATAP